jgi:hypothetical protein
MWRAECGPFIAVAVVELLYLKYFVIKHVGNEHRLRKKGISIALGLLTLVVALSYSGYMVYNWRYVKDKNIVRNEADITGRLYSFNADEEHFYVLTDFYVTNNPISITKEKYNEIFKNSVYLGNWIIPSPAGLYYAGLNGVDNPMRALVEKDNVLLHVENEETVKSIAEHLSKVLGQEIIAENVETGIWRFEIRQ